MLTEAVTLSVSGPKAAWLDKEQSPQVNGSGTAGALKRIPRTVFIIAGVLALVVSAIALLIAFSGDKAVTPSRDANTSAPTASATQLPVKHADRMIAVPGGSFMMGRNDVDPYDKFAQFPAHNVSVKSFYIDRTEVTNEEYGEFVRATGHRVPTGWSGNKPPAGQEQWPVVNVSLEDANNFAAWLSGIEGLQYRLPREDEWEYAARGGDQGKFYPWGNEWADGLANINTAGLWPVGTASGDVSRWGVHDLAGNALEWTASQVSTYPGNPTTIRKEHIGQYVFRGASYGAKPADNQVLTKRKWLPMTSEYGYLGFRLARDNQ